jgi:anti-sigma factor RsiW
MAYTLNPMKRYRQRCTQVRAQMSDYLDGELEADAAASVARHVRWCPNCRRMLENLRRTVGGLRALGEMPTPAEDPQS